MNKNINKQVNGAILSANLPTNLPWLLMQRDSMTLMKMARDPQQSETDRMSALEALGRRGDRAMESKLALLSQRDKNVVIKRAAYRALNRSQYTRSRQVNKILGGIR